MDKAYHSLMALGKCTTMKLFRHAKRFDLLVTAICIGMLGYFGWHAFYGNRGFDYLAKQQGSIASLNQELAALQQRHVQFEGRVALLRPESVDPDMLEEMARSQLGLARPNDLIVRLAP